MNIKQAIRGCKKSWTIWFNTLLLTLIPVFDYAQSQFQQLQPYMNEDTFKLLGLVILVGNIVLRFKTTSSLGEKHDS
jgi:hypothetical protein